MLVPMAINPRFSVFPAGFPIKKCTETQGLSSQFTDEKISPVFFQHRIPTRAKRKIFVEHDSNVPRGPGHDRSGSDLLGNNKRLAGTDERLVYGAIGLLSKSV
ncbi:MAG: hypothetical protein METHP_00461 [Methanoregula sp. SKADARSKE-2]|nr:MAG: hypothetical protein METHP_00461 [Methanoregula sp. SKADARSKE-2]